MPFGIIGSAVNALAGVFQNERNIAVQRQENEKNRQFQSREAALQRQFNSDEAAKSRSFSASQADLAYSRNSYGAQVAQMREAGLNPALMYQSGSFQPMDAASSAQASSSASPSGSGGIVPNSPVDLNIARQAAEIENIRANTDLVRNQGRKEGVYADFAKQFAESDLKLKNLNIELGEWSKKATEQEIKESQKRCEHLDSSIENLSASTSKYLSEVDSITEDIYQKRVDNLFRSDMWRAQLDKMASDTAKNKAEIQQGWQRLAIELRQCKSMEQLNNKLGEFYDSMVSLNSKKGETEESLKFYYDQQKDTLFLNTQKTQNYRQWINSLGVVGEIIDATEMLINGVVSTVSPF